MRTPAFALIVVLFICLWFVPSWAAYADEEFELLDGDRVVFLGAEFVEQDIKHNYLEAALSARWPERRITFRNLGWAGDDPTAIARGYFNGAEEGYRRLMEELARLKPTVIFVFYGEKAAYQGPEAIPGFIRDLKKLTEDLKKFTGRIVIVSPPPAEELPAPLPDPAATNAARQAVAQAQAELAAQLQVRYVDLFTPMQAELSTDRTLITYDTIRFRPEGYQLARDILLAGLQLTGEQALATDSELLELIRDKNELYFHRYRPQNETYLRGFRKHEQGQNEKEIFEFDLLIDQADARIAARLLGRPQPPALPDSLVHPLDFQALDPQVQRQQFTLAPGLEIQAFAAEPLVANPIHMNFDSRGRLWVATSPIYPQILPGAKPKDTVIVLEDTDGDGRADKRTVFADDLLIPTAVLPDEQGGAYVANSTELLHLADTDGDGRADQRRVVLAGFGTEDTHHILHTFRWSPDAVVCFNQSIYIHTHAETPYGVQEMLGSGIWRYRPQTARANTVMFGLVNPWGHVFDDWGQAFATDGAGGEGINYVFPGAAYTTAVGYSRVLQGMNPGQPKHCGLEIISSRHFPDDWQGTLVANDFRGNRINRFRLREQGSGYLSEQLDDLLSCQDRAFRPVDLKLGPDGALYIADWHNPIINHGEVDFRDPRRDDRHGRIWRVTVADRPLVAPPEFSSASLAELLEMLRLPEQWTRQMARIQLTLRPQADVLQATARWLAGLNREDPHFEHLRLEALWVFQAADQVPPDLLQEVLNSPDHRARAAAVRVLSQSTSEEYGLPRNADAFPSLERALADPHPQVVLEAVNALREVKSLKGAETAIRALDRELDKYLDFALYQTMRKLEPYWLPAVTDGSATFSQDARKVIFALKSLEKQAAVAPLVRLLEQSRIPPEALPDVLDVFKKYGGPGDAHALFDRAVAHPQERSNLLATLIRLAADRKVIPSGDLQPLESLLPDPQALHLAGLWNLKSLEPRLIELAERPDSPRPELHGAIQGLAAFKNRVMLDKLAADPNAPLSARRLAVTGLLSMDKPAAAAKAVALLATMTPADQQQATQLLDSFIALKEGPQLLAQALQKTSLNQELATLAVRHASSSGKRGEVLVEALRRAGSLSTVAKTMSAEELARLLSQVAASGDPQRGQEVFRRRELNCVNCHSIGGAGGQAGPDLLSLGASSPVDYIVQSLLDPSAKIKEGFHTTTLVTTQGKIVSGLLVREGTDELVLRDPQNKEIVVLKQDVDERTVSPTSIMPADLTARLARDEFVDLIAFLSALGKEGPFKVPQNRLVRRWIADDQMLYSRVDGSLPVTDLPGRSVSFEIEVTAPGTVGLQIGNVEGLRITRGAQEDNLRAERIVLDLPKGRHRFSIDRTGKRTAPLSVEVVDVEGSPAHAEPVNR